MKWVTKPVLATLTAKFRQDIWHSQTPEGGGNVPMYSAFAADLVSSVWLFVTMPFLCLALFLFS